MRKNIFVLCMAGMMTAGLLSGCAKEKTSVGLISGYDSSETKETEAKEQSEEEARETAEDTAKDETEKAVQESEDETEKESESKKTDFSIEIKTFDDGNNLVEYPYVKGLVNQEITDWYNEQFEQSAKNCQREKGEGELEDSIHEYVTITHQGKEEISILIDGYWEAEGAAHPASYARTYNINLKTGESFGITDQRKADQLTEQLKTMKTFETAERWEERKLDDEVLQGEIEMMGEWLKDSVENCDYRFRLSNGKMTKKEEEPYMYSYKEEDGRWAVVLSVTHAAGDYALIYVE